MSFIEMSILSPLINLQMDSFVQIGKVCPLSDSQIEKIILFEWAN